MLVESDLCSWSPELFIRRINSSPLISIALARIEATKKIFRDELNGAKLLDNKFSFVRMNLSTPIYLVKTRELQIYSWKKHNKSKISPFQLQISTMKRNKTEICAVVCMLAKNPVKKVKNNFDYNALLYALLKIFVTGV